VYAILRPSGENWPWHEKLLTVRVVEAVDRTEVRMVHGGEDLRFPAEACEALRVVREGVGKDLQRDVAIQLGIARPIHFAHAAGTECRDDFVRATTNAGL
jgi:hypothetical protein